MALRADNLTSVTTTAGGFYRNRIDVSLYLVINPQQCADADVLETVRQAIAGGVTAVQIRSKTMDTRKLTGIVRQTAAQLLAHKVPVLINDRIDIARTTACGVHLGQDDMSVSQARQMLGDAACIGLTVRSMNEAREAPLDIIDYVSIGGVFPTASKYNPDPTIGLEQLREICAFVRKRDRNIAIVAISGINETNLEFVLATGVDGVAVVSSICESDNPELAARRMRTIIDRNSTGERGI